MPIIPMTGSAYRRNMRGILLRVDRTSGGRVELKTMTVSQRQLRVRVLETLERRARQFRARRELWPLRVPREPVSLDEVIDEALPEGRRGFELVTLRSRSLLQLRWDDGSKWDAWVIALPSGLNLYCDSDVEESRILASCKRDAEGGDLDRFFLELLAESAGEHFGIGTSGHAPTRVRSSVTDRGFLVDVFVNLFEVTGAEASVRNDLAGRETPGTYAIDPRSVDFRTDVERWLEHVLE